MGTDEVFAHHRIMPEVPSNMQKELANLEQKAAHEPQYRNRSTSSGSSVSDVSLLTPQGTPQPSSAPSYGGFASSLQHPRGPGERGRAASYEHTNESAYQSAYDNALGQSNNPSSPNGYQSISHKPSCFPKLRDAGPNVPPSEEEKEEVLERARPLVLNSNDPEMQLAWAQDALLWVEAAISDRARLVDKQSAQSSIPKVEQNLRVDAINIVSFLAQQQHPKALFLKGTWLEFGRFGYRMDKAEAFRLYRSAAEKGYARAEYRIGTLYEGNQDMVKAVGHYSIGLEMGDAASTYRIGMLTLLGQHGLRQDFSLGIQYIRYAAEMADENAPHGAYIYGMLRARDLPDVPVPEAYLEYDVQEAKQFIEKAAYLGFSKAQQKLGQAYELCLLGCDFDPALSLHYNSLAARQGEPEAEMGISKWFLCGYEGVFDKNEEMAFTYAQRAAQGGLPTAEFAMGYFYEIGIYVAKDIQQARNWYQLAAAHGNADAGPRLQGISQHRTLSKNDHEKIAIGRIKSLHRSGSQSRPNIAKARPNPLPSMTEENADFQAHDHFARVSTEPAISRPKSAAPYPEYDMAPVMRYDHRPRSAAGEPFLNPNSGRPVDRPSSAHSNNVTNALPGHAVRPPSTMGNMPANPEPRGRDPMNANRTVSSGWQPQSSQQLPVRRPPSQVPGEYLQGDFNANESRRKPSPAPLNLGQQAWAGNSSSPPTGRNYNQSPALSPPLQTGNHSYQPAPSSHLDRSPHRQPLQPQTPRQFEPGSISSSSPGRSPNRLDSAPPATNYAPQQRPPLTTANSASAQSSPYRPSSAAAPAPSRSSTIPASTTSSEPPRRGPATFDEMGIKQAKPEGECVSRILLELQALHY